MSLLGNIIGHAAAGVGRAYDYATPGSGTSALTNAGRAVYNPNVVLSNPKGIFTKQPAFTPAVLGTSRTTPGGGPQNEGTDGSGQYAGGGGSGTPDLNQSYIDIINAALGRLPAQLKTAQANIHDQFNVNNNELDSSRDAAKSSYDTSTNQNQQQYVTNKNQINEQASNGIRSLLRILGAHGAGGSSAAQFAAPDAVADVARRQFSGAAQNYGENQADLDTNWGNFQTGYDNSKKQLNDWLTQSLNDAKSTSESTEQSLLQQLIGLQPSVAAAEPLVRRINSSAADVDQLGRFKPTYTGKTPVYNAPDIESYTVNAPGNPTLGAPTNNTAAGNPALAYLLNLGQKDRNQSQFVF